MRFTLLYCLSSLYCLYYILLIDYFPQSFTVLDLLKILRGPRSSVKLSQICSEI